MTRYDLLESFVLKLALFKWSHGSQREAHRYMLGCPRKGGGSAKNIYIVKKKKKTYIRNKIKNKKSIPFHQAKKVLPSKDHNDGNINYKIVEEDSIYN